MTRSAWAHRKRIGLLSFPRYFNYGTHLQLYALQTAIEQHGYACDVIDYAPSFERAPPPLVARVSRVLKEPRAVARRLRERVQTQKLTTLGAPRVERFQRFLDERLKLGTPSYSSVDELEASPPACDGFVVGSDQVWNPIGHHGDRAYFLSFAERSKRAAYAPSIGVAEVAPEHQAWLRTGLGEMTFLSVREQRGAEIIRELSGRDAPVVLDPTLLLSAHSWSAVAAPNTRSKPYVLLYALQGDRYIRDRALALAQRIGADLVVLPWHPRDTEKRSRVHREFDAGPEEYLTLFKHAAAVCTDSFHGSVFSVIFRRPFFTFRRYENAVEASFHSRITNLLALTGLEDREMDAARPLPPDPLAVDFDAAHAAIGRHQVTSERYLSHVLAAMTEARSA